MTKVEIIATRKLVWQLRQQYYEAKFAALVAENVAAAAEADNQLSKLAVREDALNNIESAILQLEMLNAGP